MPVGAAIAGGSIASAGIGAIASSSAAGAQAKAAQSAAQLQAGTANNAANLQLGMFNTIRGDLAPYRQMGTTALPAVYQMLGLSPPTSSAAPVASQGSGAAPSAVGGSLVGGTSLGGSAALDPNGNLIVSGINAAPGGMTDAQAQQILSDRPDVLAEFHRASASADRNSPSFLQKGLDSPLNFARWWYNSNGGASQYQFPSAAAGAGGGTTTAGNPLTGPSTSGTGASPTASMEDFLANTPGYQFVKDQGSQAITNQMTAQGLGGVSGAYAKGLAKYVTGLADTTYQQQLNNYMGLVNGGQNAAVQTGSAGTTAATGAGNALISAGQAGAAGITGAANASAAGTMGVASSLAGGINSGVNGYLMSSLINRNPGMYGAAAGGSNLPAAGAYTGATDAMSYG